MVIESFQNSGMAETENIVAGKTMKDQMIDYVLKNKNTILLVVLAIIVIYFMFLRKSSPAPLEMTTTEL